MSRPEYNQNINDIRGKLIITPDDLKASSLLDFNIDEEKILPYILEAQRLYLEPIIGTPFYRKLQNINNRGYVYDYLVTEYVTPALIGWALGVYIKKSPYQIADGGAYKHYSTDSELPTPNEIRTIAKEEFYKAQDYAWRMVQFIENYKEEYPEWDTATYEGVKARRTVFHLGGWVMDSNWGANCGDLSKDSGFFDAKFYEGNNDIEDMGFDPTTLANTYVRFPNEVYAQPNSDYYWMVSDTDFIITKFGTPVPLGEFNLATQPDETYVKGEQDGLFWIRIAVLDTYEQPVQFNIKRA